MEPIEYVVTRIDGDYAHLKNVKTGDDVLVLWRFSLMKPTRE